MRKDRIASMARMAGLLDVHVHHQHHGQFAVWSSRDLIGCYPSYELARKHIKQDVQEYLKEIEQCPTETI